MSARIDGLIRQFISAGRKPIMFSGNLVWAHGSAIKNVPLETLLRYADGLKDAGVLRIDFNPAINSLANPAVAAKYEALSRHIRELGLQLAVNPEYTRADLPVSNFEEYQSAALKTYAEWASRFKPDNFVVVHEPTTMAARMGIRTDPAQWRDFVIKAVKIVKRASPGTRVGAGGIQLEVPFYKEFATIPELDFLTVDIYTANPNALAKIEEMVQVAHIAHKPVYIEETWRPAFVPRQLPANWQATSLESVAIKGIGSADFERMDIQWLTAMAFYAASHDMEAVTPFWTTCFFAYVSSGPDKGNSPEYNKQVQQAILQGHRTELFRAIREFTRK